MTQLEIRLNKLEKAFEEIEELKKELEKEREKNKQLPKSKYNSNNYLIEENHRYAKTYEDKYDQVIERLKRIEDLIN